MATLHQEGNNWRCRGAGGCIGVGVWGYERGKGMGVGLCEAVGMGGIKEVGGDGVWV